MGDSMKPTTDDLARDLVADLVATEGIFEIVDHAQRSDRIMRTLRKVAPGALRRAHAAERQAAAYRLVIEHAVNDLRGAMREPNHALMVIILDVAKRLADSLPVGG